MSTTLLRSREPIGKPATAKAPLRADIQGLRALAVALVVVFHLWPERLTGGYIGVDLFFVISGFLITSHLVKQVERDGKVKLATFWARRVRRLLPAAFTVLGVSLVAAFVFLPKSLLQQTLYEIGASALYIQNWVLAASSVDYLGADNNPTMAQHFWSLSVEEQFYIAWPLLIVGAVWLAVKVARPAFTKRTAIAAVLVAVFVLSLAFSIYETARSQPSAYFITPTRAWEFAAGGLIAFLPAWAVIKPRGMRWLVPLVAWASLGAIALTAVWFDASTQFPGWKALIPVLAVAALIYLGTEQSRVMPGHFARFKPIQFLGDVSYSVYLWHWPLIVIFPYAFDIELTLVTKLGILVVSVLLAALTKRFVEDPARSSRGPFGSNRSAYIFMAAGMAVIVGITSVGSARITQENEQFLARIATAIQSGDPCFGAPTLLSDCSDPHAITETVNPAFAAEDSYWAAGVSSADECMKRHRGANELVRRCELGDTSNPALTVAFVGDSHAEHLVDPMLTVAEARGWRLIPFTRGGCSGLEDVVDGATADEAECEAWGAAVQEELIARSDIDLVVYSNRSKTKRATPAHVASVWSELRAAGKMVVALRDVPGMPAETKAPECVETSNQADPCSWEPPQVADFMVDAARESGTPIVDLNPVLCSGPRCHAVIGGTIAYFDDNHLSLTFAKTLAPYLGEQIDLAFVGQPSHVS